MHRHRLLLGALVAAAVLAATAVVPGAASAATPRRWQPSARAITSWQIQLSGPLDLSLRAQVFDVDGDETTKAQVTALHRTGAKVICYVSAGSYEDWRDDAARFPAAVLGKDLDGWPGERWLDVRRWDVLGPIMRARFQACRAKGFDAVDPDNMDGYANDSGFRLTAKDQLLYNKRIAAVAHALGLAVGLKNDLDQVNSLVHHYDFAVNEQCAYYRECGKLTPFVARDKPVFEIEYEVSPAQFCPASKRLRFEPISKKMNLGAYRRYC